MEELVRTLRGEAMELYLRITARERQALVEQYRKGFCGKDPAAVIPPLTPQRLSVGADSALH